MTQTGSPRWVEARAKCSVDLVFAAIADLVERDVKDANEFVPEALFTFERCDEGIHPRILVVRFEDGKETARVNFEGRQRSVSAHGAGSSVHADLEWNRETASCELRARPEDSKGRERRIGVGQFCQRALEPLFFPG